jgi:hypothetical protein
MNERLLATGFAVLVLSVAACDKVTTEGPHSARHDSGSDRADATVAGSDAIDGQVQTDASQGAVDAQSSLDGGATSDASEPDADASSDADCPAVLVEALGTAACLDLSNMEQYPGSCSMTSTVLAVSNEASFGRLSCSHSYEGNRLASTGCHYGSCWAAPSDGGIAQGCDSGDDGRSVAWQLSYDSSNEVTEVGYGEFFGASDSFSCSLALSSRQETCCHEEDCANSSSTNTLSEDTVSWLLSLLGSSSPLAVEGLGWWISQNDHAECSTTGSVEQGSLMARCGNSTFELVYDGSGRLKGQPDPLDGGLAPHAYQHFYDQAGNLRFVLEQVELSGDPQPFENYSMTLLHQNSYECWQ